MHCMETASDILQQQLVLLSFVRFPDCCSDVHSILSCMVASCLGRRWHLVLLSFVRSLDYCSDVHCILSCVVASCEEGDGD